MPSTAAEQTLANLRGLWRGRRQRAIRFFERHRLNRVAGEVPPEPPVQVFVQQDVHSGWLQ